MQSIQGHINVCRPKLSVELAWFSNVFSNLMCNFLRCLRLRPGLRCFHLCGKWMKINLFWHVFFFFISFYARFLHLPLMFSIETEGLIVTISWLINICLMLLVPHPQLLLFSDWFRSGVFHWFNNQKVSSHAEVPNKTFH